MISPNTFRSDYSKVIAPVLDALEPQRLALRRKKMITFVSLGFGMFFFVMLCANPSHPWYLFIPSIFAISVSGAYYKRVIDRTPEYVKPFKQGVIGEMVRMIGTQLNYYPEEMVPAGFYDECDLYPEGYDIYQGEDFVEGMMGKTRILFSELSVMRRRNYVENADATVLFNGLFFVADFNKNFSGRTYVWDRDERAFNILNKSNFPFAVNIEKVLLESPAFSHRFVAYSTDQVEARYILSPSLMEKLVKLSETWRRNISFSFVDSKVYIAIPTPYSRNLFEPGIMKRPGMETMEWYYELLYMLVDIVEELNLNLRIWNKP